MFRRIIEDIRARIKAKYPIFEFVLADHELPRITLVWRWRNSLSSKEIDCIERISFDDLDLTFEDCGFPLPIVQTKCYDVGHIVEEENKLKDEYQLFEWQSWCKDKLGDAKNNVKHLVQSDKFELCFEPFYPLVKIEYCLVMRENHGKKDNYEALTFEDLDPTFFSRHPTIFPKLQHVEVLYVAFCSIFFFSRLYI